MKRKYILIVLGALALVIGPVLIYEAAEPLVLQPQLDFLVIGTKTLLGTFVTVGGVALLLAVRMLGRASPRPSPPSSSIPDPSVPMAPSQLPSGPQAIPQQSPDDNTRVY